MFFGKSKKKKEYEEFLKAHEFVAVINPYGKKSIPIRKKFKTPEEARAYMESFKIFNVPKRRRRR